MDSIEDYWNDETNFKVVVMLKEHVDTIRHDFTKMNKGKLEDMWIDLKLDAKLIKRTR